jgi:hypothetical protein
MPIKIGLFCEDYAHETMINGLVSRLFRERGINFEIDTICSGGGSKVIGKFKDYMATFRKSKSALSHDLLIIVHDCNCKGKLKVQEPFIKEAKKSRFPEDIICFFLPDPYIQRWYLADGRAFLSAINGNVPPKTYGYIHDKRRKDYYKNVLDEELKRNDILSPLIGAEYGSQIADLIDFQAMGTVDTNFPEAVECIIRRITRYNASSSIGR